MTGDMRRATAVLKRVFGYADFRPGQGEIVGAVLAGRDVFAVMPTAAVSRSATSCRPCSMAASPSSSRR